MQVIYFLLVKRFFVKVLLSFECVFKSKLCDYKILQSSMQGRISRHEPAGQSRGGDNTEVHSTGSTKKI